MGSKHQVNAPAASKGALHLLAGFLCFAIVAWKFSGQKQDTSYVPHHAELQPTQTQPQQQQQQQCICPTLAELLTASGRDLSLLDPRTAPVQCAPAAAQHGQHQQAPQPNSEISERRAPQCWWSKRCPLHDFHRLAALYAQRHSGLLSGQQPPSSAKYMVYVAGGNDGYGNRLPGVATAFVLALLTDRIFLVHWEDSYSEPARFSDLFAAGASTVGGAGLSVDVFDTQLAPVMAHIKRDKKIQCASKATCYIYSRDDFRLLAESNLSQMQEQVVFLKSDDNLLPLLQANPNYAAKLSSMLGPSNKFGTVGRWLLHPSAQIAAEVESIIASTKRHLVGMHLRLQRPIPNGGAAGTLGTPPEVFFRTALLAAQEAGFPPGDTTFYIATDLPQAQQEAVDFFKERGLHLVWQSGLSFGNDGDRSSKRALLNAVVDMMVVSQADALLGTYGSSFSSTSAALGGILRWEIKADRSYWQALPEPCYRFSARGHWTERFRALPESRYHELCMLGTVGKIAQQPTAKGKRKP